MHSGVPGITLSRRSASMFVERIGVFRNTAKLHTDGKIINNVEAMFDKNRSSLLIRCGSVVARVSNFFGRTNGSDILRSEPTKKKVIAIGRVRVLQASLTTFLIRRRRIISSQRRTLNKRRTRYEDSTTIVRP